MVFGHALKGDLILSGHVRSKELVGSLFVVSLRSGSQAVDAIVLEFAADPLICFDSSVDIPFRWAGHLQRKR